MGKSLVLLSIFLSFLLSVNAQAQLFHLTLRVAGHSLPSDLLSNYPLVRPGENVTVVVSLAYTGVPVPLTLSFYLISILITRWTPSSFPFAGTVQGGMTFNMTLKAPIMQAVDTLNFWVFLLGIGNYSVATVPVEISCSDGVACNGDELFVNGACVAPSSSFCTMGTDCTTNTCDNTVGVCHSTLPATHNSTCRACLLNCEDYLGCDGRECGTDGCGGNCGTCTQGTYCNHDGQCVVVNTPGTCSNPIKLFQGSNDLTGVYYFFGDNSQGYHYHVIPCNAASTSPEIVYQFTVPPGQTYGFDFRSNGTVDGLDTVMDVRLDSCDGEYIGCNDDATPPSGYGSRVARMIGPGTYVVIVKGYDESQQGNFTLYMSFRPNCIPKCNSQFCGDDECGGTCGTCSTSQYCSENFKCVEYNCIRNCTGGNECGFDSCGGYCGSCTDGLLCNLENSKCELFYPCDGLNPYCDGGCSSNEFCGSDCACHGTDDPLPDLFVDRDRLAADVVFDSDIFKEQSCAYREGCISGIGRRRLLRFSVLTTNQGRADIALPPPASRPDMFTYSPCHGHYHFVDYAYYALLTPNGSAVVEHGRKQGYCVLDGSRQSDGNVGCLGTFTCDSQGISVGWADTYTYDLDCQWIDITDVAPGNYLLYVELNRLRKITESDYSNNKAWVSINVPTWDLATSTTTGAIPPTNSTTGSPVSPTTGGVAPVTTTTTTATKSTTTTTSNYQESLASTVVLSIVLSGLSLLFLFV